MGGGGPIPHVDNDQEDSISYIHRDKNDDFNDFFDYKIHYFDSTNRDGIFHYCVIAHYFYDMWENSVKKGVSGCTYPGYSSDFCILGAASSDYGRTLQHELGHNLLGFKIDATHYGDIYLNNNGHHNINSCRMHKNSRGSDYCSRCWSELDLTASLK
jgi:hypothetical protein